MRKNEAKGYENVPCKTCNTPLYGGYVESPLYKGEYEKSITMYVGYCTKCKEIITDVLEVQNV